jgi:hypothetical protein
MARVPARYLYGGLSLLAMLAPPLLADSYYTVTPCRVLDTRSTNAPVQTNTPIILQVGGLCGIPPTASSVSFNVTLVGGTPVDLGMTAGDAAPSSTNVVSSTSSRPVAASNAVIALSSDNQGTVLALATNSSMMSGSTDLLLDVDGYFMSDWPGGIAEVDTAGGVNDPGNGTDPLLDPLPTPTLGQPLLGNGSSAVAPGTTSGSLVSPIRQEYSSNRYFFYRGAITPLIGVSADAACEIPAGNGTDICTFDPLRHSYYQRVLDDAKQKGLNKIRLWVNISGGTYTSTSQASCVPVRPAADDQPFVHQAAAGTKVGTWNLDQRDKTFFSNLQQVVNRAQADNLIVEVTFFAPWVGGWELSPWNPLNGRFHSDGGASPHGFSDRSYFVKCDGACGTGAGGSPNAQANEALRLYQLQVIDWTIDALDAPPANVNGGLPFDNVYYEIANEPEYGLIDPQTGLAQKVVPCDATEYQTAVGADVVAWQQMMVNEVLGYESRTYVTPNGPLAYNRLVAVQPFSVAGTSPFLPSVPTGCLARNGGTGVCILNGHYATISPNVVGGSANMGLGAITLARSYAKYPIIIAANEDKISGDGSAFPPWGGKAYSCGWEQVVRDPSTGLPLGSTGVDCYGEVDSARAQAWEFILDGGAAYDHYGYYYDSGFGALIRQQLGSMQRFLQTLPWRQLMTAGDPAGWVNIGLSPYSHGNAHKYWAALKPTSTATSFTYLLYLHNSALRTAKPGGVNFLQFGGYVPLATTSPTSLQYSETLTVSLASQLQHYQVQWLDPKNPTNVLSSYTIPGNSPANTPLRQSPSYAYDILLKITQVP